MSGAVTNQRLAGRLATALGEMKEKISELFSFVRCKLREAFFPRAERRVLI